MKTYVQLNIRVEPFVKKFIDDLVARANKFSPNKRGPATVVSELTRIVRLEMERVGRLDADDEGVDQVLYADGLERLRAALVTHPAPAPRAPQKDPRLLATQWGDDDQPRVVRGPQLELAAEKPGRRDRRRGGARLSDPSTWPKALHAELDQEAAARDSAPVVKPKPPGVDNPTLDDLRALKRGSLVCVWWPGGTDGRNTRMARFVRIAKGLTRPDVMVELERIDRKGKPLGGFSVARAVAITDILSCGPYHRRVEGRAA